jgi:hypothetical protein
MRCLAGVAHAGIPEPVRHARVLCQGTAPGLPDVKHPRRHGKGAGRSAPSPCFSVSAPCTLGPSSKQRARLSRGRPSRKARQRPAAVPCCAATPLSRAAARRERAAAGQADPRLPAPGPAVRAAHPQGARGQAAHGRPRAHHRPRAAWRRRERQGRRRARCASGWGGALLPRGMAQRPALLRLMVGKRHRSRGLRPCSDVSRTLSHCALCRRLNPQASTRVCSGSRLPGAARPSTARAEAGARRRGRRRRERRGRERAGDDRGAGARGGPGAAAAHLRGAAAHHRRDPGRGVRQQARRGGRVPGAGARAAAPRAPLTALRERARRLPHRRQRAIRAGLGAAGAGTGCAA